MRIIAIINQKGGCGKTTTAINLAGVLAKQSKRTLLVDLDPQSHCAAGLAIPEQRIDVQIGDAMLARPDQNIDWTRLLWRVSRHLDLAPSTVRLAALESARGGLAGVEGAELRLAGVLSRLADQYDFCIVDCPPNIGLLTFNALAAATEVIIPVETAFFALQGAAKQVNAIKSMGKRLNLTPVYRVLPTLHDAGSSLSRDVLEELNRRFGEHLIPITIRFDHRLREAVSFGQPVIEYATDSAGAQDYLTLGQWLIDGQGKGNGKLQSLTRNPKIIESPVQIRGQSAAELISRTPPAPAPAQVLSSAMPMQRITPPTTGGSGNGMVESGGVATIAPPVTAPAAAAPSMTGTGAITESKDAALSADEVRSRLLELTTRVSRLADKARSTELPAPVYTAGTNEAGKGSLYGVRRTSAGILFVQPLTIGKQVLIAGEFNNWNPTGTAMVHNEQLAVWERVLAVPPGRWQYRLVIDGVWTHDTFNPVTQSNPFGGLNSIIEVQAGRK